MKRYFDFKCSQCGYKFEAFVEDDKIPYCPKCASIKTEKKISAPLPVFKGKGFYATDYGRAK